MTEAQESTVLESTQDQVSAVTEKVKKPRTELQMAALEQARQKAFAIRAQKKLDKEKEKESLKPEPLKPEPTPILNDKWDDKPENEEIEYIKKTRKQPKKKRIIVVQEESSSEDEIEVRLPKRQEKEKFQNESSRPVDEKQLKFEASMQKMFSF